MYKLLYMTGNIDLSLELHSRLRIIQVIFKIYFFINSGFVKMFSRVYRWSLSQTNSTIDWYSLTTK